MDMTTTSDRRCYANRELSWLRFNERVLEEATDPANPLFERLNFVSIFQSNLDEFYMVRVGMLMDTLEGGVTDDKLGMTSREQLSAVIERTTELLDRRDSIYKSLMGELKQYGIELCKFSSLSDKTQALLEKTFRANILPLLSPQIVGRKQPFPFLANKAIYAVAALKSKSGSERMGIVPCDEGTLPRLIKVPGEDGKLLLIEDVIAGFLDRVFEHYKVTGVVLIRIERSADIDVDEGDWSGGDMLSDEYRKSMEKMIKRRKRLNPVKLEYYGKLGDGMRDSLSGSVGIPKKQMFASDIPLDLSFIRAIKDYLRDKTELFYPRRTPQNHTAISQTEPMTEQVRRRDLLLSYPYESIRPLMRLLQEAGSDPEVVSIKMTLYRVAEGSKIVEALVDAAENGKEVVVLVELRARFDEENNLGWSRVLERAGCRVIYGLDGMKVHSKLLLITRYREGHVEYITQVGTGNYNEDTVRLYTDYALMTASPEIGAEAANVFNCLSMGEVVEHTEHLLVAPKCLRSKILGMIDGEIACARSGGEAYLGFKLNGLTDKVIISKLIEASQAGVKIDLLVRGICCIVGGAEGYTENIRVCSIVGRYLEHSRIYIFGAGERRKVYISSADFMTRNTTRRVEVAAPIYDEGIRAHIEKMFFDQLRDSAKLRVQQPDGSYLLMKSETDPFNTQETFADEAASGAWWGTPPEPAKPEVKAAVEQKPEPQPEQTVQSEAKPSVEQKPQPKRGFFARLFGKK